MPGPPAAADVGLRALDAVLDSLQPDAQWLSRGERAFSWIPYRLTQTVSASPAVGEGECTVARLTARTIVVESVTAPEEVVLPVLSALNRHALGSAYTYHADGQRIEATTIAVVHDETVGWRSLQFAGFAMLQLGMTHTEARYLADRCGGRVAAAPHPQGLPDVPDPFIGSIDEQWAKAGRAPSPFADSVEFSGIEAIVASQLGGTVLDARREGIAMTFPFADETSFARLDVRDPHRRIGNGLRVRLFLPVQGSDLEQWRRADALNRAEALGGSDAMHYGAWCLDSGADGSRTAPLLQYQAFVPGAFHRPGVARDAAVGTARRARWVDSSLHGREH